MKKAITWVAIAISLNVCIAYAGQTSDSNIEHLSVKGRAAYHKLFSAGIFRVGGVGYSGETSAEELALYDLLAENEAVEALKSLVSDATYEGGLYGLLGLSIKNIEEFNRAVDVYKSRNEPPERETEEPFPGLRIRKGKVAIQSGCIIEDANWLKIVQDIQSGHYDYLVKPYYDKFLKHGNGS